MLPTRWAIWRTGNKARGFKANMDDAGETIIPANMMATLTQLPAIMHGIDRQGRLLFVSEKWQAALGYSADAVLGRHITEFMEESSREWARQETLPRLFRDGRVDDLMITMIHASGEQRSLVLSSQAQLDAKGNFLHSFSVMIDITDRMADAEALEQSERRFRGSFQTAPYGMALVAPDGGWIEVNDQICTIVGYSKSELLATDFQTITHPEDLESDLHLLHELLDDKIKSYQLEKRYIRKDGLIVPCMLSVSLVRDSQGAPVHFVSQIQDLSEQKLGEARLLRAQKLEAVGQLTGGMAHDFNNLLTVAVGSLQLLEHKVGDDRVARQRWEAAMSACEKGAELTKRMLAFARRQSLAPETLDPAELVSGMEELLRRTLGANIELVSEIGPDVPKVNVDRSQMESALLNLALNARDAMPKGGRLSIQVEAARLESSDDGAPGGEGVRITVSDTGTGIAPEVLAKVFEPFFTTKGTQGRGSRAPGARRRRFRQARQWRRRDHSGRRGSARGARSGRDHAGTTGLPGDLRGRCRRSARTHRGRRQHRPAVHRYRHAGSVERLRPCQAGPPPAPGTARRDDHRIRQQGTGGRSRR